MSTSILVRDLSVPPVDTEHIDTQATLVVGSDLFLSVNHVRDATCRTAHYLECAAFDGDANPLAVLMRVPWEHRMPAVEMLRLCVPTAERFYPTHLRSEAS